MKSKILTCAIALAVLGTLAATPALPVFKIIEQVSAANPDTVNITVRIKQIGIACNRSDWDLGWVELGSTTATDNGANWSNITNTGNYPCDFHILGEDSESWTLEATAGADQFGLEFIGYGTNASQTDWHALTGDSDNDTIAHDVAASSGVNMGLRFSAPTSTDVDTQESLTLTLSAVLS